MRKHALAILLLITLLLAGFSYPGKVEASGTICHTVKRGETLSQIASYYGVTVAAIQQANNLWNPNLIYVGQCLKIPTSGSPPPGCVKVHVVKRGEYLKGIAAKYGTTWQAIAQLNGLKNPNVIYVGQRLKIPCGSQPVPPKPPSSCVKIHVVKPGEYLKTIAAKYGTTWQAIARLNGLSNPNRIYSGQRLKIPVKCTSPGPTPPKPGTGPWTGVYWNNRFLSGDPKFSRKYERIDFGWGKKGPGGGIGGTNFSARYTRTRYFDAGTYRFNVIVDDGVRVFLDGVKIIDQWHDSAPRHYTADRQLSAGNHTIQIDYYQNKGGARLKFWPDALNVPKAWKGDYFNNTSLNGAPVTTKGYNAVNFDWGNKSPAYGVTADYFSARFTTESHFDGGRYRFTARVDDGIRIYLDDNLILDDWRLGSARTIHVDVDVGQGNHRVRVEYFENTGDAVCKVSWAKH